MKKILAIFLSAALLAGCQALPQPGQSTPPVTTPPGTTAQDTRPSAPPPTTAETHPATDPAVPTDPPAPQEQRFQLSFAGDCTFGNQIGRENDASGFLKVVGDNYDYPMENVRDIFLNDDFTFVNLEVALTDYNPTPQELVSMELDTKQYRFRGPREYVKILRDSGVEFATTANNHARDYGMQGWRDTNQALADYGMYYGSFGITCLAETESGLKIGIVSVFFGITEAELRRDIAQLRSQGAELIVMSIHWGDEGKYTPNSTQRWLGHMAIDNGVDIVHGHHPHALQPIEYYNGGMIFYSLGNFSFGGNVFPSDKDTAIIQQEIVRSPEGGISLGAVHIIPCRVSSVTNINDYRPTPYEESDPGFHRVMAKLTGTYEK